MFEHGFPPEWSTLKKLIWLKGSGILGAAGEVWKTVSGAIVSFVTQRSAALRKLVVDIEPVQSGSGDPSPTNLRPITGWTGANIYQSDEDTSNPTTYTVTFPAVGNNILDMSDGNIEVGKYIDNSGAEKSNASNFYNSAYFPVKASTAYTISTSDAIRYCSFMEYDENKTFIKRTLYGGSTAFSSQTHTMGDTTAYIIFGANPTGSTVSLSDIQQINWMLNEGSTDLPYEPYTNTVYSGTLDVLTGKLTVDKVGIDLGEQDYTYNSSNKFFQLDKADISAPTGTKTVYAICSAFKEANTGNWTFLQTNSAFRFTATDYTTVPTFKTAVSGFQFVYELATPVEYTLTGQEVSTLVGNNTMWADTGDVEVTYLSN